MNDRTRYILHISVLVIAICCAVVVLFVLVRNGNQRNAKLIDEFQTLTKDYKSLQNDRDALKARVKLLEETVVRRNEQIKQLKST